MLADVTFLAVVTYVVAGWIAAMVVVDDSKRTLPSAATWTAVAALWLVVTALPTLTGVMSIDGRVPPQLFMALILATALAFSFSSRGSRIADVVPVWLLVGFQGFRLPLEWVLHQWGSVGTAPPQMTWSGQNFDVITGVLALAFIPLMRRERQWGWVPTVVGLGLLLNIGRIVATSLPGPLQRFEDPLLLPLRFPHVWIGSVCVAAALGAHVLAIRALLRPGEGESTLRRSEQFE